LPPSVFHSSILHSPLSTFYLLSSSTAIPAATSISTAISAGSTTATPARTVLLARFFSRPAFEHSLTRQADLALRVNVCDHHGQFIAEHSHIFNFIHALAGKLEM
jgi:hypothetical protein